MAPEKVNKGKILLKGMHVAYLLGLCDICGILAHVQSYIPGQQSI